MRISTTTLESFRLFMSGDWMTEDELIAGIKGEFVPTVPVKIGSAWGKIIETPTKYLDDLWYVCDDYAFNPEQVHFALTLFDRRGFFEVKSTKQYGEHTIVAKVDHIYGAHISEIKSTLKGFNFDKYAESCQWRFYLDIFLARKLTYHVFCLNEPDVDNVVYLDSHEPFHLYPYAEMEHDCFVMVEEFAEYAKKRNLESYLQEKVYR